MSQSLALLVLIGFDIVICAMLGVLIQRMAP